MTKGFREGRDRKDIMKEYGNYTDEQLQDYLKELSVRKEFDGISPGTYSYKIALLNDQLRRKKMDAMNKINDSLKSIGNIVLHIRRLKSQLVSGEIVEKISDIATMNEDELRHQIFMEEHSARVAFQNMIPWLGELRTVVGHFDVARNIVMTEEEYDAYVKETEKRVKEFGYDLFEGV